MRSGRSPLEQVTRRLSELEHSEVDKSQRHPKVFASVKEKGSCFLLRDKSFAFVCQKNADGTFACEIVRQRHTSPLFHQPCSSGLSMHRKWSCQDENCTTARKGSVPEGGLPPTRSWWFCPHTPFAMVWNTHIKVEFSYCFS